MTKEQILYVDKIGEIVLKNFIRLLMNKTIFLKNYINNFKSLLNFDNDEYLKLYKVAKILVGLRKSKKSYHCR